VQHTNNWLLIICSLTGFGLVAGSLALLWCRRITLDGRAIGCQPDGQKGGDAAAPGGQASQAPTQPPASELSLWGKIMLKTPYPVLIMLLMGAALLAFPVYGSIKPLRMVNIKGKLGERGKGTMIQVVAIADERPVGVGQTVNISVPYLENGKYVIKYTNKAGRWLGEDHVYMKDGTTEYELLGVNAEMGALNEPGQPVAQRSEVEDKNVVDEFGRGVGR
jgi:hypothetical protein